MPRPASRARSPRPDRPVFRSGPLVRYSEAMHWPLKGNSI